MNIILQNPEFKLKKFIVFVFLIGGWASPVFAQASSLSLPNLPPLPPTATSNAPAIGALPPINLPIVQSPDNPASPSVTALVPKSPQPPLANLPPLPGASSPVQSNGPDGSPVPITLKSAAENVSAPASAVNGAAMPPLPAVTSPIASAPSSVSEAAIPPLPEFAAPSQTAVNVTPTVPTLPDIEVERPLATDGNALPALALPADIPALPLPGESVAANASMSDTEVLAALEDDTDDTPVIKVVREQAPKKSWESELAPSLIPKETTFNYKRELLPEAIYRTEYNKYNRHLPRRMSRDDYAGLLFNSVAKNDLNTTRALLNTGVSLNVTNPYGETPLQLARRMGAEQVAQLLIARGAVN